MGTATRKLKATIIISTLTLSLGVRAAPPTEAVRVAEIMLLYQRDNGGWPKNYDKKRALANAERTGILAQRNRDDTTFDNGTTHSEVRHQAKVYQSTGDNRYQDGDTFVVQAGPEFKVIAGNALNEMCVATPAAPRGSILIRTLAGLYRIGE